MDRCNLAIDAIALVVYLATANPVITGVSVHEWLGLGVLVVVFTHTAMHAGWAVVVAKSVLLKPLSACVGNLVLDMLMIVVIMMVTISGLMVSGTVLSTFGLYADGYYFWDPLHAASAKVLLALLLVHVAVHRRWIVSLFAKAKNVRDGEWGGE